MGCRGNFLNALGNHLNPSNYYYRVQTNTEESFTHSSKKKKLILSESARFVKIPLFINSLKNKKEKVKL